MADVLFGLAQWAEVLVAFRDAGSTGGMVFSLIFWLFQAGWRWLGLPTTTSPALPKKNRQLL